jgi:hypothetical protein
MFSARRLELVLVSLLVRLDVSVQQVVSMLISV